MIRIIAGAVSITLLLSTLLLLPPIQSILTKKASGYVEENFGVKIHVGRLYIRPPETISLDGLYLKDEKQDTLLYAGEIRITASLFDLLQKKITVKTLQLEDLTAKISREPGDSLYNFRFIIDAFSSKTRKPKPPPAKPWSYDAGEILLRDIRFTMDDQYAGIFLKAKLRKGKIKADKLGPEKKELRFKDIALSGFDGLLLQDDTKHKADTAATGSENPEAASPGLLLASGNLELKDIRFVMNRPGSAFHLVSGLEYFHSSDPEITLGNLHINIKDLYARQLAGKIEINGKSDTTYLTQQKRKQEINRPGDVKVNEHLFGDFNLKIRLGHGKIEDSYFSMEYPAEPHLKTVDYHHMELKDIGIDLKDAGFYNDGTEGRITAHMSDNHSGLTVENLTADVIFNNDSAGLKNLVLETPESRISGNIFMGYPSMRALKKDPGALNIDIFTEASLSSRDLARFLSHDLVNYPDSSQIKKYDLTLNAKGDLGNLKLKQFKIEAGKNVKAEASGMAKGLPEIKNTYVRLRIDTIYAPLRFLQAFTGKDSLPGTVRPEEMLRGNAVLTGCPDSAQFLLQLNTAQGFLKTEAELKRTGDQYHISSHSGFALLQVGALSGVNQLGTASGSLDAGFVADTTGILSSQALLIIDSVFYNGYQYRNIRSNLHSQGTQYTLQSVMKAPEIAYTLNAGLEKTGIHRQFNIDLQVHTMDLAALNFIDKGISASGNIHSVMDYQNERNYSGNIEISNLLLKGGGLRYPVNKFFYVVRVDSLNNYYEIDSDILYARLTGNIRLIKIPEIIANHIMAYIHGTPAEYDYSPHFDMDLKLFDSEILTQIIVPELEDFSLETFNVHYDDSSKLLSADIRIPDLTYSNIHLDTLLFNLHSTEKTLTSTFMLNRFSYDSLRFDSLNWNVATKGDHIFSRVFLGDSVQSRYQLGMRLDLRDSSRILSFVPGQLSSNGIRWQMPEENEIVIHRPEIKTRSVNLESEAGHLTIEASNDDVRLLLKDFALRNLTAIFTNPGIEKLLSGKIDGTLQIENIFSDPSYSADLQVKQLESMGSDLGEMTVVFKQPSDTAVNLELRLISSENNLISTAVMETGSEDGRLDVRTSWEFNKPEVFQPWTSEYIKAINGALKGEVTISGTRKDPVTAGKIQFKQFNIVLAKTNTQLQIRDETITMDDNGFHFGRFQLYDSLDHSMVLQGDLLTTDYSSFQFGLSLNTDKFLIVNNTRSDLESVYGKLMIGADIKLTGKSDSPVIDSRLDILKETDITYAMAGSDLILQSDEGVVVYSDKDLTPDSLASSKIKRSIADSLAGKITGLNLKADISVDKNAQFTLITNPNAGDFAKFKISGRLIYQYNPAQSGILTGKITLMEGVYELSFYGLIHKKFTLVPDSYINWSGAVMDGNIYFQAKHVVKSNSVGLVGAEVTEAEKANYNQRLPYEVILNITGLLSEPQITFNIDLPETYLAGQPLIESKLQSLNQEGMENERNRQALALLVGGTFIPEKTSGDNEELGFATTAAMNTMNSIITQQLNNLSGMLVKGMEINMGINRIDNYGGQTAGNNTRTQLDIGVNKYFLENRVLVGVEGHIDLEGRSTTNMGNTSTMTEFIVEYLLTKNGNYRIKAFRENAFDLIDGEIQNTGLAFIFVVDFGKQKPSRKTRKRNDKK